MRLKLKNKWFEVGETLSQKQQTYFLNDALDLYNSRPFKDLAFYCAIVTLIFILSYYGQILLSKFFLISTFTFFLWNAFDFNKKYDKFEKRWFK